MPIPKNRRAPLVARGSYTFRALAAGEYELLIYGDIGKGWWSDTGIDALAVVQELQNVVATTIHVRLASDGGSLSEGLAIYNALVRHAARIVIHVDSVAMSIASVIACAGDEVRMPKNAMLMIHGVMGGTVGAMGNAEAMREYAGEVLSYAEILDKMSGALLEAYVAKAGEENREAIAAQLLDGKDHYYSAAEAVAAGLCDVIDEPIALAAVHKHDLSRFKSLPAAAAVFQKEATMNFKMIALALGLSVAATSTEADIRKAVCAYLKLSAEADDAAIETAMAAHSRTSSPEAVALERTRITTRNASIRQYANIMRGHVPAVAAAITEIESTFIDDPARTIEGFHAALAAKLGENSEPLSGGLPSASAGEDVADKRREGMTNALLMRMGAAKQDGANPWRGLSMREMARETLVAQRVKVEGEDALRIAQLALSFRNAGQSIGDFMIILENTLHKLVLNGFTVQAASWQRFCKIGDVSDFRDWNRLVPGLISDLDDVNENGEYLNKNLPDATGNAVRATRKGNIISITPEVIVNDDIGYVQDAATGYGRAGSRTIERRVYTLLAANPVLRDGNALFSAAHGNLAAAGAAPTVVTLDAGRVAMQSQKSPGEGADFLDIMPSVAVSGLGVDGDIRTVIGAEYDTNVTNKSNVPNRVRNLVKDVVGTPRITGNAWYLFADPNQAPCIEVVFLNGQREPRVVQEENFRTGGQSWRIELPFGVGAIDYRGGYKNPGV